jgi:hypothetical protein
MIGVDTEGETPIDESAGLTGKSARARDDPRVGKLTGEARRDSLSSMKGLANRLFVGGSGAVDSSGLASTSAAGGCGEASEGSESTSGLASTALSSAATSCKLSCEVEAGSLSSGRGPFRARSVPMSNSVSGPTRGARSARSSARSSIGSSPGKLRIAA